LSWPWGEEISKGGDDGNSLHAGMEESAGTVPRGHFLLTL